jgi:class 3 adenylate cyclase
MRYALTADGVRIAYGTAGQGLPLIRVPNAPFSHCQLEWRDSTFYERLSQGRMVVTFDPRGTGMSVTKAMDCAIALQRAFAAWNAQGEHAGSPLHVRVGLNAGEPIEEDGDLFGSTVILASRIAAKAGAGEILIPEPLRHLLSGKSYVYADRGAFVPKGFDDAVRLFEVRWR